MGKRVSKTVKFLSPLQSLTIFPTDMPSTTPRDKYLRKFDIGLEAEKKAREILLTKEFDDEGLYQGKGWEQKNAESEKTRLEKEDRFIEDAYDHAIGKLEGNILDQSQKKSSRTKYQFVGIVQQPRRDGNKVRWYARKRPLKSKWNIRLIHVNRDAILKDLFVNGKIDVFAKYSNTLKPRDKDEEGKATSMRPVIEANYHIKKRSLSNLWNFNLKHFFTDSSGSFWRERRLPSGLYTDGTLVYESDYRYSDGKNGMKPISKLDAFLASKSIKDKIKTRLIDRLEKDAPDVVIED